MIPWTNPAEPIRMRPVWFTVFGRLSQGWVWTWRTRVRRNWIEAGCP